MRRRRENGGKRRRRRKENKGKTIQQHMEMTKTQKPTKKRLKIKRKQKEKKPIRNNPYKSITTQESIKGDTNKTNG